MAKILRPGDERDILAAKFEVETDGVFHFKNLYEWMYEYLEENDWSDAVDFGSDKIEHHYWETRKQDGKREHHVWWRVQKRHAPGNEYWRWVMLINFRNLKAKKVEVMQQGQKISTWRTNLTLQIEAWLQLDFNDMWRDHWLLKHFDSLYRKRIFKKQVDKWKKDLWREAYAFGAWIKQYLGIKSPYKAPEQFHPPGGVGPTPEQK